jgi:uncharacterized membrane protein
MALGAIEKLPCAGGNFDGRQYTRLCYTDLVPLVGTEQLAGGRLPFLDPCQPSENNCDEYPVLTMYFMRLAAWVGGTGYTAFFWTNSLLLTVCAAAIGVWLWMLSGRRTLWFALAPTLAVYGLINWDLLAVALATGALVAFAARRDGWAGALLGLGAATKLYPIFFVLPLFLQGLQDREPDRSVRVLWWSTGTYAAVNAPFAIAAPSSWAEFFRFNAERIPDFDSLWYIACRHTNVACAGSPPTMINVLSAALFVGGVALLWWLKVRRNPDFPRWTLIFPIVVVFLLVNKVYSPQYGLWLLPLFALTMVDMRSFLAFSLADVAVFVTRFWFFGWYTGTPPPSYFAGYANDVDSAQSVFELAVGFRAAILIWALVQWVRHDPLPLALGARGWRRSRAAREVAA